MPLWPWWTEHAVTPLQRAGPAAGLTLLELLVTVAVGAVLLTVGVPGFRHLLLEARLTAAVNTMVHDLHLARQVANLRGQTVLLCPAATAAGCPPGGRWQDGWAVVVADDPPTPDAPGVLAIRERPAGIELQSNRRAYAFRPFTRRDTNGTIGFCDSRGSAAVRALVISPTGRPRLASSAEARARIKC